MGSFLGELPEALSAKITKITTVLPDSLSIFEELYTFGKSRGVVEQDLKRRKLDNGSGENGVAGADGIPDSDVIFQLNDVSVLSPLRKKLNFVLHLSQRDRRPSLSLRRNDLVEFYIEGLGGAIELAVFLPVPEKSNIVYLFIKYRSSEKSKYSEPILLALNKAAVLQQFHDSALLEQSITDFNKCVEYMRKQAILTGFRIADPFSNNTATDLHSFHLECHRGTKEGTLYFLPDLVIFGFKKPILLFNSKDIESITYSSITRLTFDMTLMTKEGGKYEFSMIDQSEYGKIDEYVKRKQVEDKSMSEELKYKSKKKTATDGDGTETPSALREAAIQMGEGTNINNVPIDSDDEEDDANFEGGSDLSDGSGSESESEGDSEDNDSEEEEEDKNNGIDLKEEVKQEQLPQRLKTSVVNNHKDVPAPKREVPHFVDIPIEVDDDDDEDNSGVEY
ncbi:Rtt106p KNAG_0F01070 [Huiozyma naganishii CBS 8797]|uniref:Histone chaperone RTT106 n=1 Tax=Huiozyma naganishii (strain ATCC MYA-139 / BCRC 22969 / CBS 8797 / KCTC 17520 / NBRC 10181 / NCYC 3082 / Yp74L-3) TaxID=1071383 RepID=J7R7D3_HUIN7|nr:hypothetical protein KNAG_0F01070 [Kazachstania naganishii CBS 8797]CCK70775.1 hypothetical protein KNAG_0F01070 [Kazachstania naganishii CBS 8797]